MNLNIIPTTKIAMLCAAFCAALFAFNPNASALTIGIGDAHYLGLIDAMATSATMDRAAYINYLIGMAVGNSDTFNGEHLHSINE